MPDIFEVYWIGSTQNLTIKIHHKTGLIESYNLYDAKSKQLALAKYNPSILFNYKTVLASIEKHQKIAKV